MILPEDDKTRFNDDADWTDDPNHDEDQNDSGDDFDDDFDDAAHLRKDRKKPLLIMGGALVLMLLVGGYLARDILTPAPTRQGMTPGDFAQQQPEADTSTAFDPMGVMDAPQTAETDPFATDDAMVDPFAVTDTRDIEPIEGFAAEDAAEFDGGADADYDPFNTGMTDSAGMFDDMDPVVDDSEMLAQEQAAEEVPFRVTNPTNDGPNTIAAPVEDVIIEDIPMAQLTQMDEMDRQTDTEMPIEDAVESSQEQEQYLSELQNQNSEMTRRISELERELNQARAEIQNLSTRQQAAAPAQAQPQPASAPLATPTADTTAPSEPPVPTAKPALQATTAPARAPDTSATSQQPQQQQPRHWVLRSASASQAYISEQGNPDNLTMVRVGEEIPGLGRVSAITFTEGIGWRVLTTGGELRQQ